MIFKLLIAALVAYGVWRLWHGIRKPAPHQQRTVAAPDDARAREVLGIGAGASAEEIRAAHRRLVTATHPDRGGSAELTRQLNAARDQLLKRASS
ncbi:DnaJ domain-containing protein [Sphingomonas guangdongensis]|uniref:DnaJ domain-containing protein n=1 Tax=Sphingomonas guangdongensis TaxID=1141890 RepID=A0A285QCW6_9SPHN|nr:DnaJ domain-containing protein [Sphingomonas guangdongensis]SOB79666.1 DnaJ domain-containing protein [Sphingomonas guangdongensis]